MCVCVCVCVCVTVFPLSLSLFVCECNPFHNPLFVMTTHHAPLPPLAAFVVFGVSFNGGQWQVDDLKQEVDKLSFRNEKQSNEVLRLRDHARALQERTETQAKQSRTSSTSAPAETTTQQPEVSTMFNPPPPTHTYTHTNTYTYTTTNTHAHHQHGAPPPLHFPRSFAGIAVVIVLCMRIKRPQSAFNRCSNLPHNHAMLCTITLIIALRFLSGRCACRQR